MSMATLGGWGVRRPSRHMFHGTLMMSLFQIAGHVFSSMAIARVPVSTVHTIKVRFPLSFFLSSFPFLLSLRPSLPSFLSFLLPSLAILSRN